MFLQKTLRAQTEKPVLNEDLIKTLPPARNPRLLPKLDKPINLPPLELPAAQKDPLGASFKSRDTQEEPSTTSTDQTPEQTLSKQKRPSQASAGLGRDSGFRSNSAGSERRTKVVLESERDEEGDAGNRSRRASKWSVVSTTHGAQVSSLDGSQSDNESLADVTITPSLKLNSIKWLWILFLVYVLCWCPFYVLYLLLAGSFTASAITWDLYATFRFTGAINSALNPLILLLVVHEYRQALACLLRLRDPNTLYAHMQADFKEVEDEGEEEEEEEEEEENEDETETVNETNKRSPSTSSLRYSPSANKDKEKADLQITETET